MFTLHDCSTPSLSKLSLACLALSCMFIANPQWAVAGDKSQKGGGMKGYMDRLLHPEKYSEPTSSSSSPTASTSQLSLTFTGMEGSANPSSQTLNITNTGGGTLSWSASAGAAWLSLSPTSGTTTTETDVVTVSVDTTGLTANTYTGTITLTFLGSTTTTQQIPVTFTVTPPTSTIGLSPASLGLVAQQGGAQPSTQTFYITNKDKGTLNWSVNETAGWLSLSPASGTTTTETDGIIVIVDTVGLTANTYTAPITITASGASNTPQQLLVTLFITAPASGMAKLTWDANTESDLAGYKVYWGTSSGTYGSPLDVKNVTSLDVVNLTAGQAYYFAVTAYSTGESGFSNEVSKSIP